MMLYPRLGGRSSGARDAYGFPSIPLKVVGKFTYSSITVTVPTTIQ